MTDLDLAIIKYLKSGYTAEQIIQRVQYGTPIFADALSKEKLYIGGAIIVGLEDQN